MSRVSFEKVEFDADVDVLIVGAGATGLTAGLAARAAGAEVFVLERNSTPAGSTAMSQGLICAAGTNHQREAGVADSPDQFYEDIMTKTRGTVDPVIARTVANEAGKTIDWLVDRFDIPLSLYKSWGGFFGHSTARIHGVPTKTGTELLGALLRAAEQSGVELVCDAHVTEVFADRDGRIRGVEFTRPDGGAERIGCRALVAATCGFGANHEMVRRFIPSFGNAENYRYFGHEGNEGSGIEWGMQLGAGVGSMDSFQGYGALSMPQFIVVNYDMVMAGGFAVNIEGKRFSNEIDDISGQALKVLMQPQGVAWMIFDDAVHESCKHLSEYRELDALGGFKVADTVGDLAEAMGVPAAELEKTFAFAEQAAAGAAACPFGRDFTTKPPLRPSYHAVRITGALFHTQGGLLIDGAARVLRADGTALPNYFAGGGAARGISGDGVSGYLPAAGLCTAVTLGRLAGESAARVAQAQHA